MLGEGWCRKKLQESFDRGFFYCWAEKDGQVYDDSGPVVPPVAGPVAAWVTPGVSAQVEAIRAAGAARVSPVVP